MERSWAIILPVTAPLPYYWWTEANNEHLRAEKEHKDSSVACCNMVWEKKKKRFKYKKKASQEQMRLDKNSARINKYYIYLSKYIQSVNRAIITRCCKHALSLAPPQATHGCSLLHSLAAHKGHDCLIWCCCVFFSNRMDSSHLLCCSKGLDLGLPSPVWHRFEQI